MDEKPNVFIIDDKSIINLLLMSEMKKAGIDYVISISLKEAEDVILNFDLGEFDLIVIDARFGSNKVRTMHLIEKILKTGFNNPIIANSTMIKDSEELIKAGATHLNKDKTRAVSFIKKVLNGEVEEYILKDSGSVT